MASESGIQNLTKPCSCWTFVYCDYCQH